ncbi:ABC transporter ATP-binding protein [Cellulosilyticum ruminicola]|uniref:ABC transporter ATP-binding protein n=1 Tax=Cellulosilyticum ruminicola TaxID=425254 RepID=UPI0006D01FA7|nr:ABC transporter ATP-binding protein [Cellulosilyticum ruminicola]
MKRSISYLFKEIWSYKPSYFIIYTLQIICKGIFPFINVVFPKYIIDELLGERDIQRLVYLIAIMIILNLIFSFVNIVLDENISKIYNDDFNRYFETNLSYKVMQIEFKNIENKEVLEQVERAKTGLSWSGGIGGIIGIVSSIISSCITLIGTVGILMIKAPILIVIVLINVIIDAKFNNEKNKIQRKNFEDFSPLMRKFSYVFYKLTEFRYGKEIRLYNAEHLMLNESDKYNQAILEIWKRQSEESYKYMAGMAATDILRNSIAYGYLGYLVIKKMSSIGDFSMLINTNDTLGNVISSIIIQVQELQKKSSFIKEYIDFMELEEYTSIGHKACGQQEKHTIEFKHVYFAYPGTNQYILENISLYIEAGEHLSVVGLNGAGKTTFVKLICRLYEVTSGEILLDGCNINEYELKEYMKLISVVFQDFRLLAFSVKENIALEDAENIKDKEIEDIIKQVNLQDKINELPYGLETSIFKYYDEQGFEPSGGEQQKLAIARAIYKNAPIVILDEPTAALDPLAEQDIYLKFNELAYQKTAIFISHRLASCKFCDKIAVFADGKIVEYGTHYDLIKKENGIYSELFNTQAKYYA